MPPTAPARQALVATLRRQVARLEGARPPEDDRPLSTGSAALDRLLPTGGLSRGTLVEYFSPGGGSGAGTLALTAAREACREGRAAVLVGTRAHAERIGVPSSAVDGPFSSDGTQSVPATFYPPAAAAWGIDLARLLILQPANAADALWALDQALRCRGVGAVWAECDRL